MEAEVGVIGTNSYNCVYLEASAATIDVLVIGAKEQNS